MPRTRVKIIHKTVQEYLDGKYGVGALLDREAEKVLANARDSAPVRTGRYKRSLHIETDHTDRTRRAIVADVPYGFIVEADHGTLSRALRRS